MFFDIRQPPSWSADEKEAHVTAKMTASLPRENLGDFGAKKGEGSIERKEGERTAGGDERLSGLRVWCTSKCDVLISSHVVPSDMN